MLQGLSMTRRLLAHPVLPWNDGKSWPFRPIMQTLGGPMSNPTRYRLRLIGMTWHGFAASLPKSISLTGRPCDVYSTSFDVLVKVTTTLPPAVTERLNWSPLVTGHLVDCGASRSRLLICPHSLDWQMYTRFSLWKVAELQAVMSQ